MKAVQFDDLTFPEKALLLYSSGKYLMSVSEGHHTVHLFSLDSKFIELYFNQHSRIIDKIAIADSNSLDKYLNCIVIKPSSEGRPNGIL